MIRHRFRGLAEAGPVPGAAAPVPSMSGFVVCPLAVLPGMAGQTLAWQQVHQFAQEQARAVLRPSPVERFAASLN